MAYKYDREFKELAVQRVLNGETKITIDFSSRLHGEIGQQKERPFVGSDGILFAKAKDFENLGYQVYWDDEYRTVTIELADDLPYLLLIPAS